MKAFVVVSSLIIFLLFQTPLEKVREEFPNINNLEQAESFITQLENDSSPEAKGYMAAMVFMKSRYVKNPFTKLKYFKKGKNILDKDISENPLNVEIRYIRYVMQKQIPDFLGYNEFISEDFNVIIQEIDNAKLDGTFKTEILKNMLLVENLEDSEKEKIKQTLSKL